jgi:hypothetical protein
MMEKLPGVHSWEFLISHNTLLDIIAKRYSGNAFLTSEVHDEGFYSPVNSISQIE